MTLQVDLKEGLYLNPTDVEDLEKSCLPTPPPSLEPTLPSLTIADEDSEFPEGGRGWIVVLGAFIHASLVLGWQ